MYSIIKFHDIYSADMVKPHPDSDNTFRGG